MTSVRAALESRISTRAFRSDPIPEAEIRAILDAARRAPSGGNLQPWGVVVVAGAARDGVVAMAQRALADDPLGDDLGRPVYPPKLWEPYRTRRFAVGEAMYARLEIPREDKPARLAHLARNFQFFDAPVGLFFTIDARMGHAQWCHLGMFMMAIALAAEERGLATCFQEAWAILRPKLHAHFALSDDVMIASGMAMGHADPDAPVNRLRADRESVDAFARLEGFSS